VSSSAAQLVFYLFVAHGVLRTYRVILSFLPSFLESSNSLHSTSKSFMSDAGSDARSQLDIETVQRRTEACEKLVDNAITGLLPPLSLFERLKEAGATPEEAQDYINDFVQRHDRQ
jgi:hypothetical protein